jgi:hypothetical protein
MDRSDILASVCAKIEDDRCADAAATLTSDYPFIPLTNPGRRFSVRQSMRVFVRDGFIDRYSRRRLIFPGTLRMIAAMFPKEFPFHSNWRTDACHFAFYELFPTIDHLVPVSRGGADSEDNWVTTSMVGNAAKANFTIEELGWCLFPVGDIAQWDGLTGWFLRQYEKQSWDSDYLRRWADAARRYHQSELGGREQ